MCEALTDPSRCSVLTCQPFKGDDGLVEPGPGLAEADSGILHYQLLQALLWLTASSSASATPSSLAGVGCRCIAGPKRATFAPRPHRHGSLQPRAQTERARARYGCAGLSARTS